MLTYSGEEHMGFLKALAPAFARWVTDERRQNAPPIVDDHHGRPTAQLVRAGSHQLVRRTCHPTQCGSIPCLSVQPGYAARLIAMIHCGAAPAIRLLSSVGELIGWWAPAATSLRSIAARSNGSANRESLGSTERASDLSGIKGEAGNTGDSQTAAHNRSAVFKSVCTVLMICQCCKAEASHAIASKPTPFVVRPGPVLCNGANPQGALVGPASGQRPRRVRPARFSGNRVQTPVGMSPAGDTVTASSYDDENGYTLATHSCGDTGDSSSEINETDEDDETDSEETNSSSDTSNKSMLSEAVGHENSRDFDVLCPVDWDDALICCLEAECQCLDCAGRPYTACRDCHGTTPFRYVCKACQTQTLCQDCMRICHHVTPLCTITFHSLQGKTKITPYDIGCVFRFRCSVGVSICLNYTKGKCLVLTPDDHQFVEVWACGCEGRMPLFKQFQRYGLYSDNNTEIVDSPPLLVARKVLEDYPAYRIQRGIATTMVANYAVMLINGYDPPLPTGNIRICSGGLECSVVLRSHCMNTIRSLILDVCGSRTGEGPHFLEPTYF
ncbi:hypothetical protein FISHEDRAFT_54929 [Fistulina hepatica ATCC 64428]|uniref:Uncharacterized protein n=1 Tax=Fistulina hepatica ATCC 64428 TaxID=1128425 RepID=A0A0D7ASM4_9AGAR|nr:hypothetical protein FISHEDRAFT_54929 [Fistulina hepatica ATCC 64428]